MARFTIKVKTEEILSSRERLDNRMSTDTELCIKNDVKGQDIMNHHTGRTVCTHIRKLYLKYWLDEMANWLLEGKEYKFLYKQILMRIVNRDTRSRSFKYKIKTQGRDPVLFIKITTNLYRQIGQYYLAKIKGDMKKRLDKMTEEGIEFISLKDSGYVNFK